MHQLGGSNYTVCDRKCAASHSRYHRIFQYYMYRQYAYTYRWCSIWHGHHQFLQLDRPQQFFHYHNRSKCCICSGYVRCKR